MDTVSETVRSLEAMMEKHASRNLYRVPEARKKRRSLRRVPLSGQDDQKSRAVKRFLNGQSIYQISQQMRLNPGKVKFWIQEYASAVLDGNKK
jgi:hypothetical protein